MSPFFTALFYHVLAARPWLKDDLDTWIERSKVSSLFQAVHWFFFYLQILEDKFLLLPLQGPPHKLAVIFVDNSGVDIILGMFPFVRELLSRGTKVNLLPNGQKLTQSISFLART